MSNSIFSSKHVIWALGFRSFFLFASLWSIICIFIWIGFQDGWLNVVPFANAVGWHAHEMLFGFILAIVAGFLLTASQNWTGKKGVSGSKLQLLFLVWFLGRILPFVLGENNFVYILSDLAFLPLLTFFIFPYLGVNEQKRNWLFFGVFAILFFLNLVFHLQRVSGFLSQWYPVIFFACVLGIQLIVNLIGSRVLPFFASRVLPKVNIVRNQNVEIASQVFCVLHLIAYLFFQHHLLTGILALFGFAIHLIKFLGWKPWASYRIPILWILYTGYFWVVFAYALAAAAHFLFITSSIAIHAFTVGSFSIFIYGMMTRVSLGHTGRVIHASKLVVFGYVLVNIAAFIRVLGTMLYPAGYKLEIHSSGWFWFLAFLFFTIKYWVILTRPRVDGQPG